MEYTVYPNNGTFNRENDDQPMLFFCGFKYGWMIFHPTLDGGYSSEMWNLLPLFPAVLVADIGKPPGRRDFMRIWVHV